VRNRFRSFCFGLILSVIGLRSGLFGYAKEKFIFCRDFVVDCVASAFVLPKTKIPIVLSRGQRAMQNYKIIVGFIVAIVAGHFSHKMAVNVNA